MKYDFKNISGAVLSIGSIGLLFVGTFAPQPLREELWFAAFLMIVAAFGLAFVYNKVKFGTFFLQNRPQKEASLSRAGSTISDLLRAAGGFVLVVLAALIARRSGYAALEGTLTYSVFVLGTAGIVWFIMFKLLR